MAKVESLRSAKLFELIGAPLVAMIQADAQAARATVEFIETVGFLPDADAKPAEGEEQAAGRLRMARFRYRKTDENGEIAEFEAAVPILSLVPIPALQIKEAKIALAAKITDLVSDRRDTAGRGVAADRIAGALRGRALQVMAKPVASSGSRSNETRGSYDLDIQITLGQADLGLGVEKVLQVMDQAIAEQKTGNDKD